MTAVDLHNLVAIGFHIKPLGVISASASIGTTPIIVSDSGANILANLDRLNTNINSIYSITQTDTTTLNLSAVQSVQDSSILMLLNLYNTLSVAITGTSSSDTIFGIGNGVINGCGGVDTISLLCHTSKTQDVIVFNSAVSTSNLEKVTGFLSTDKIQLANSSTSLNGLTNLATGAVYNAGTVVTALIQTVTASNAFTVSTSGIDMIDITGATFTNITAVISSLSSSSRGSTYATFGSNIAKGSHFLVQYTASDGVHIAEITQGATSNHLASTSTGVDLIDLVGVTQHVNAANLMILAA